MLHILCDINLLEVFAMDLLGVGTVKPIWKMPTQKNNDLNLCSLALVITFARRKATTLSFY